MRRIILSMITGILLWGGSAHSQSLNEVLNSYFETIGQEELIASNNARSTGKIIQGGLEIPFVQYASKPYNFRVEGTFQGLTFIQVYNGSEGWSINPFEGATEPQPMGEDELKALRSQADYLGQLWDWEKKGLKVSLEGTEEVEGTSCYKIKLVTADEDEYTYFVDAESYILIKTGEKVRMQGNVMETETFMSNYKEKDGIAYPGKIETRMGGQVLNTIVIDTMEMNVELVADFFSKPKTN